MKDFLSDLIQDKFSLPLQQDVTQQLSIWNPPLFSWFSCSTWMMAYKGVLLFLKLAALLFGRSWGILCYARDIIWEYLSHILCKIKGLLKSYFNFKSLKARGGGEGNINKSTYLYTHHLQIWWENWLQWKRETAMVQRQGNKRKT